MRCLSNTICHVSVGRLDLIDVFYIHCTSTCRIRDYVDFEAAVPASAAPRCDATRIQPKLAVDQITPLGRPQALSYKPEVHSAVTFTCASNVAALKC